MPTLLLGYGDIAHRTAKRLVASGHKVTGLCRHPEKKLPVEGVELVAGDFNNGQDLLSLFDTQWDNVVVTLTPASTGDNRYYDGYVVPCRHLQQVLAQRLQTPYIIYVSSTGVYAQVDGEWVNEASETLPASSSGKTLLQAEGLIDSLPTDTTILRCSGIYGEGRDALLKQLSAGKVTLRDSWTNRIHQDDVAGFIHALITTINSPDSLYLASDDMPVKQYQLYQWLADQLGIKLPCTIEKGVGPRGAKRCSNQRLRSSGYTLKYPSYIDGYQTLLESWSN